MAVAKDYIGDGVYIQDTGYSILLTAENGVEVQDRIELDPSMVEAIVRYGKRIEEDRKANSTR